MTEALRAQLRATLATVEGMRWPRIAVLVLLSSAAGMVFVAALRLRWPRGEPRLGVSALLSRAALGAAVLRTLDGAQDLIISRAAAAAFEKVLRAQQPELAQANSVVMASVASVGTTVVVAGLFIALANYFQSERIQQTFQLIDRNTPEE